MIRAIRITLLSLIAIALVVFMTLFISGKIDVKDINKKSKLVLEETYSLDSVKSISVDTRSSDIIINESKDDNFLVKVYSHKKDGVSSEITDSGELKIVNRGNYNCVFVCTGSNKIEIYVPSEYAGKVKVNATSADIESTIKNYLSYEIKLTSGDIEIKNAKKLTGKATSGDIEVDNISNYIDFKCTSGDIDISNLTLTKDSKINVTSGDVKIRKIADAYVETSVKSGDVRLKNNDRHAKYVLSIKTTSGDIKVN